jgi:hypothetical protein
MAVQRSATESDVDYTDALITVGRMVSEEAKPLEEAPEPPSQGSKIVDNSLLDLESTYMTLRAQEDLESIRSVIDEVDTEETGVSEAKIMLRKAQDAFKVENYAAVTVLERTVRDLLTDEKPKKVKGAT